MWRPAVRFIRVTARVAGSFSALEFFDLFDFGRKHVKLCKGILDGAVRVFGDETIAIFGYDAGWEMDTLRGGGWMRLTGDGLIEGEFVGEGDLGSFTAKRLADTK